MTRYIDVDKIKFSGESFNDTDGDALVSLSNVRKAIEQTPTAEVVEVVRCKDCKHHFPPYNEANLYSKCRYNCLHTHMNDFCSYGERKEQG